jgi:hypothetical protein
MNPKTITEIRAMRDKDAIQAFVGVVVNGRPPKPPTENQQKFGEHPQSITLRDAEGEEIEVSIIRSQDHFTPAHQGKRMRFEAGEDPQGRPSGVTVNTWQGKSGDKMTKLVIDAKRGSRIYDVTEAETAQRPATSADVSGRPNAGNRAEEIASKLEWCWNRVDWLESEDLRQKLATTLFIQLSMEKVSVPRVATAADEVGNIMGMHEEYLSRPIKGSELYAVDAVDAKVDSRPPVQSQRQEEESVPALVSQPETSTTVDPPSTTVDPPSAGLAEGDPPTESDNPIFLHDALYPEFAKRRDEVWVDRFGVNVINEAMGLALEECKGDFAEAVAGIGKDLPAFEKFMFDIHQDNNQIPGLPPAGEAKPEEPEGTTAVDDEDDIPF